ncbi:MAG TPA: cold shock domain-containing protein [Roseateles sp.]
MRSTGILRSWNDERGFGFIAPTEGGAELFVHISEFPRDGSRPVAGETVSFERGRGKNGKPQAVKVVRSAVGLVQSQRRSSGRQPRWSGWLGTVLVLCLVAAVLNWAYGRYQAGAHRRHLESLPPVAVPAEEAAASTSPDFRCDGRTHCSQMKSCAEATWFINHCPGTQMDGNHDGVPCEQQWCTGPAAR